MDSPRTAHVATPGDVAIHAGLQVATGSASAAYSYEGRGNTAHGDGVALSAQRGLLGLQMFGLPTGGGSLGLFPGCELGATLQFIGAQGELRCQPVGYGGRGPFEYREAPRASDPWRVP